MWGDNRQRVEDGIKNYHKEIRAGKHTTADVTRYVNYFLNDDPYISEDILNIGIVVS